MSATGQRPDGTVETGRRRGLSSLDKRSRRELARAVAIAVLAILITLFAVFNLDQVKVSYVVGSGKAPLIIVIVISALVGIVIAYIAQRLPRKRR
jgi:uncharacterized integral membrane protein